MHHDLIRRFHDLKPAGPDHLSLRLVDERSTHLVVRNDVAEAPRLSRDVGVMITVHEGGGLGYAATPDLSPSGLRAAIAAARRWATVTAPLALTDTRPLTMPTPSGRWTSPDDTPWDDVPIGDRVALLRRACAAAAVDDRIVDRTADVLSRDTETTYLTADGAAVYQRTHAVGPDLGVVAHANGESQRRSLGGGRGMTRQGGAAQVLAGLTVDAAHRVADDALALLAAPNCPSGATELVLAPDQMMIQIHESIGHPLELDRILGDERNYAGTSFVTLDMFGRYQYGSELLNVTFAPDVPGELAGYGWDDDGVAAKRQAIISRGRLMRPLGGVMSQARAGLSGVANQRASSWNRAPIDRMANLNVEPGDTSMKHLIGGIERGVYMTTNTSWSIDDSRNKFQFGCELGREIVNGELGRVLKNPNYRGVSASFWRGLSAVGDRDTFEIYGTPYCGKGEPNQVIAVGHASPACRFSRVDVFGGAA